MSAVEKEFASGRMHAILGHNNALSRILVVDDNVKVLNVVSQMLYNVGYRVDKATGGMDAMRKFSQNNYDVVIADLDMPDMDGFSLGARLRKASPAVKLVIMTGRCQAEVDHYINSPFIDHWIFKPFRFNELRSVLKKMC